VTNTSDHASTLTEVTCQTTGFIDIGIEQQHALLIWPGTVVGMMAGMPEHYAEPANTVQQRLQRTHVIRFGKAPGRRIRGRDNSPGPATPRYHKRIETAIRLTNAQ